MVENVKVPVVFEFEGYDYYLGLRPSEIYYLRIGGECFNMRVDADMTVYDIRVYPEYIQVFYGTVSYKGMEVKIPYELTEAGLTINGVLCKG